MQALFDGAVVRLPCVNRDWAGQAAGPAMSAMPRKRRLAIKMWPVEMGQQATSPPIHIHRPDHRGGILSNFGIELRSLTHARCER